MISRLVRSILETRGPASKLGTFAKVYYVAQISVDPPTIGMVVNRPELFDPGYERFLINRFREELPFPEVPIKLVIKGRRRDKPEEAPFRESAAVEAAEGAAASREAGLLEEADAARLAEYEADLMAGAEEEDASAYFEEEE